MATFDHSILTPRERQVFEALLRSETTRQIAESKGLRYQTVKNYLTTIYAKLGVSNRIELCDEFSRSTVDVAPWEPVGRTPGIASTD